MSTAVRGVGARRGCPRPRRWTLTPLELEADRERIGSQKTGLVVKPEVRGDPAESEPPSNRTPIERPDIIRHEKPGSGGDVGARCRLLLVRLETRL